MFYWYSDKKDDDIKEKVSKAYGITDPQKIHGYFGVFEFVLGEVWLSDNLKELINDESFVSLLKGLIERFRHDDYGEVLNDIVEGNKENRYFFGCFIGIEGLYSTDYGNIAIKVVPGGRTEISLDQPV